MSVVHYHIYIMYKAHTQTQYTLNKKPIEVEKLLNFFSEHQVVLVERSFPSIYFLGDLSIVLPGRRWWKIFLEKKKLEWGDNILTIFSITYYVYMYKFS